MNLKILVGTVTNTAEYAALAIQMDCADRFTAIDVILMDNVTIAIFDEAAVDTVYLICTSTYGAGDVPDNALGFYASLESQARYLGHVRYGVFALGDLGSHAQTYCGAGELFDARLADLGAKRLGDMGRHDLGGHGAA